MPKEANRDNKGGDYGRVRDGENRGKGERNNEMMERMSKKLYIRK